MDMINGPVVAFLVSLTIQTIIILIKNRKNISNKDLNIIEDYKRSMKLVKKLLIAIIISLFISFLTLCILGMPLFLFLNRGH